MFDDKDAVFAGMRAGGTVWVQDILVEPTRLVAGQAKMGQGGGDPVVLGHGERHRVDRSARNDRPLERSVAVPERRVGRRASRKPRMAATSGLEAGTTCTWTR